MMESTTNKGESEACALKTSPKNSSDFSAPSSQIPHRLSAAGGEENFEAFARASVLQENRICGAQSASHLVVLLEPELAPAGQRGHFMSSRAGVHTFGVPAIR